MAAALTPAGDPIPLKLAARLVRKPKDLLALPTLARNFSRAGATLREVAEAALRT